MTVKEEVEAAGVDAGLAELLAEEAQHTEDLEERTERLEIRQMLSVVFSGMAVIGVLVVAVLMVAFNNGSGDAQDTTGSIAAQTAGEPATGGAATGAGDQAGAAATIKPAEYTGPVETYKTPDPSLPETPPGAVKKFRVEVFEHVTRVARKLPPTRVWSYGINGVFHRGTGVSEPMVVTQGDMVEITLVNGGSEKMDVQFPHSIDYHSSEVAPDKAFATVAPGETHVFSFRAKHAGVFMYHCATQPVLLHTGAGMVGMMIVKPKDLAPVDKELWITQQEFYIGEPGKIASEKKMAAKTPDVIAFNGFADQYKDNPIVVGKGERVRMYVLNAGPSIWSAFHVIGTVFDRTVVEGTVGKSAQTINLAPSQGGWVEFTLDREGAFPFVTHAFGDMTKGALGVLATEGFKGKDGH